ncbi:diphthine--ammonia ligase [Aspergillus udagawae]|nr:diphthine--ammonia ligase [Aspergillus udagawae]GFF29268.1 diphthine--ammonia ligase [Aspergillus udagawae]GFG10846.1 diphthine--ammonia ligase [Aspergillus udagawae]
MSPPTQTPPATPGLNVIALISGGKDSLYSILHCIRNGHKVVALANLYPSTSRQAAGTAAKDNHEHPKEEEEEEEEDIDSFMYQTIGHSVIPLYEAALGIPLYRAPITGDAVDTSRIYRHNAADQMADEPEPEPSAEENRQHLQDETESLVPLLRRVQAAHPEANAVSAGAILSTYQRTRIENVAARLGLVPLAWLWQYPVLPAPAERRAASTVSSVVGDAGLLEDMAACGCEARIIKVASGGLDEGFLWGDLSSADGALRRRIVNGMKRFAAPEDLRGAVLGEGGEYESLALDGPKFLWRSRIEVCETEVRTAEGGVGYVRLKGARCVPKTAAEGDAITPQSVRRPMLLDDAFARVLGYMRSVSGSYGGEAPAGSISAAGIKCEPRQLKNGGIWHICNIIAPQAGTEAAEQMKGIAGKIRTILQSSTDVPRSTEDIVFTTVLLRSMADFASMNDTYVSLFKKPNPPARATVACGDELPEGVNVMVSFIVDLGDRDSRQGLHVQSRSYWAPANIGPYSQAMSIPLRGAERIVYIAGQIPLEPASMQIVCDRAPTEEQSWLPDYSLRVALSLQHMWRIGAAMQVDWWLGAVAFITGAENIAAKARVASHIWETMNSQHDDELVDEEESTFDVWDIKYGGRAQEQTTKATVSAPIPNFEVLRSSGVIPPFLAVQVEELPRASDIEWQGLGYRCDKLELNAEETDQGRTIKTVTEQKVAYTSIEIDMEKSECDLKSSLQQILAARTVTPGLTHAVIYTTKAFSLDTWPGEVIPCKSVWGHKGRRLAAGIIFQSLE